MTGAHGLVSCLCVTRGNVVHVARALRCYESQTYPERELVVVADRLGEEACAIIRREPTARLVEVERQPLGALRNVALREARGTYFAQWDDDDWHAPGRLQTQLEHLVATRADACVLARWLLFDELSGRAGVSIERMWEGSLLAKREILAVRLGYPELGRAEDTPFLRQIERSRIAVLRREELYIYVHHGANVWSREHFNELFECDLNAHEAEGIRRLVTGDGCG